MSFLNKLLPRRGWSGWLIPVQPCVLAICLQDLDACPSFILGLADPPDCYGLDHYWHHVFWPPQGMLWDLSNLCLIWMRPFIFRHLKDFIWLWFLGIWIENLATWIQPSWHCAYNPRFHGNSTIRLSPSKSVRDKCPWNDRFKEIVALILSWFI